MRIRENIFGESFSESFAKFLGEFISVRIHATPVFTPARVHEKILANCLCIGYGPRGRFGQAIGLETPEFQDD